MLQQVLLAYLRMDRKQRITKEITSTLELSGGK